VSRSGNAAHVHHALDSVRAQKFEECLPYARGVPNRENGEHFTIMGLGTPEGKKKLCLGDS
jgi:hypothetical protein